MESLATAQAFSVACSSLRRFARFYVPIRAVSWRNQIELTPEQRFTLDLGLLDIGHLRSRECDRSLDDWLQRGEDCGLNDDTHICQH